MSADKFPGLNQINSYRSVNKDWRYGGPHSTMDRILASRPAAPGSIPGVPKNISEEVFILYVAKVNQRHCFLGQWTAEA